MMRAVAPVGAALAEVDRLVIRHPMPAGDQTDLLAVVVAALAVLGLAGNFVRRLAGRARARGMRSGAGVTGAIPTARRRAPAARRSVGLIGHWMDAVEQPKRPRAQGVMGERAEEVKHAVAVVGAPQATRAL